jgi:hypothetical protein
MKWVEGVLLALKPVAWKLYFKSLPYTGPYQYIPAWEDRNGLRA